MRPTIVTGPCADGKRLKKRSRVAYYMVKWTLYGGVMAVALALLSGCAPMTPEQRAAFEEQERDRARDCQLRGGWYVSGSCVSRAGGP